MAVTWIVVISGLLVLAFSILARIRYVKWAKIEKLHQRLGSEHDLQVAYLNSKAFTIFGSFRNYSIHIEAIALSDLESKSILGVKCQLPMTNPNRKALRIAHLGSKSAYLNQLAVIDRPVVIKHGFGENIEVLTNDLLFSGIILSDDVKISLYEVLKEVDSALLYLYDTELVFIWPESLTEDSDLIHWSKVINLLCDMKDELNI